MELFAYTWRIKSDPSRKGFILARHCWIRVNRELYDKWLSLLLESVPHDGLTSPIVRHVAHYTDETRTGQAVRVSSLIPIKLQIQIRMQKR